MLDVVDYAGTFTGDMTGHHHETRGVWGMAGGGKVVIAPNNIRKFHSIVHYSLLHMS